MPFSQLNWKLKEAKTTMNNVQVAIYHTDENYGAVKLIQDLLNVGFNGSYIEYCEDVDFEDQREVGILSIDAFIDKYNDIHDHSANGLYFAFVIKRGNEVYRIETYQRPNKKSLKEIRVVKNGTMSKDYPKKIYLVEPLKKVNDIAFGMSRENVRELLGEYTPFVNGDRFKHCYVYYKDNKICAMDIKRDYTVLIDNVCFESYEGFNEDYRKMKLIDENAIFNDHLIVSYDYSLSISSNFFTVGIENYLIDDEEVHI